MGRKIISGMELRGRLLKPLLREGDECPGCQGLGSVFQERDCHKSAGWIPCEFTTSEQRGDTRYIVLRCIRGKLKSP